MVTKAIDQSSNQVTQTSQTTDVITAITPQLLDQAAKIDKANAVAEQQVKVANQRAAEVSATTEQQKNMIVQGVALEKKVNADQQNLAVSALEAALIKDEGFRQDLNEADANIEAADNTVEIVQESVNSANLALLGKNADGSEMGFFKKLMVSLGGNELAKYANTRAASLTAAQSALNSAETNKANLVSTEIKLRTIKGKRELESAIQAEETNLLVRNFNSDLGGLEKAKKYLTEQYGLDTQALDRFTQLVSNEKTAFDAYSASFQNFLGQEQMRIASGQYRKDEELTKAIKKRVLEYNALYKTTYDPTIAAAQYVTAIKSNDYSGVATFAGNDEARINLFVGQGLSTTAAFTGQSVDSIYDTLSTFKETDSSDPNARAAATELSLVLSDPKAQAVIDERVDIIARAQGYSELTANSPAGIAILEKAKNQANREYLQGVVEPNKDSKLPDAGLSRGDISINAVDLEVGGMNSNLVKKVIDNTPKSLKFGDTTTNTRLYEDNVELIDSLLKDLEGNKLSQQEMDAIIVGLSAAYQYKAAASVQTRFPRLADGITVEQFKLNAQGTNQLGKLVNYDLTNLQDWNQLVLDRARARRKLASRVGNFGGVTGSTQLDATIDDAEATNAIYNRERIINRGE